MDTAAWAVTCEVAVVASFHSVLVTGSAERTDVAITTLLRTFIVCGAVLVAPVRPLSLILPSLRPWTHHLVSAWALLLWAARPDLDPSVLLALVLAAAFPLSNTVAHQAHMLFPRAWALPAHMHPWVHSTLLMVACILQDLTAVQQRQPSLLQTSIQLTKVPSMVTGEATASLSFPLDLAPCL